MEPAVDGTLCRAVPVRLAGGGDARVGVRRLHRRRRAGMRGRQRRGSRSRSSATSSRQWRSCARRTELRVEPDDQGDLCGHGNACAGVIRALAPDCEIHSVRVLGAGSSGQGAVLVEGLRHAVQERYDVINLSLSTTNPEWCAGLHELVDQGVFQRSLIVASAHNMPVESFPWRFASVISVGSHDHPARLPGLRTRPAGRSVRTWGRRRGRVGGRRHDHRHRKQLRNAPHLRHLRADPRQAPDAGARCRQAPAGASCRQRDSER